MPIVRPARIGVYPDRDASRTRSDTVVAVAWPCAAVLGVAGPAAARPSTPRARPSCGGSRGGRSRIDLRRAAGTKLERVLGAGGGRTAAWVYDPRVEAAAVRPARRISAGSWPRTRSCSRRRRRSTGSAPGRLETTVYPRRRPSRAPSAATCTGRSRRSRARPARLRTPQRPPADARSARSPRTSAGPGIKRVTGKLLVDDTVFDRRRGVPTSGVDASGELRRPAVGPLATTRASSTGTTRDPELVAARALERRLRTAACRSTGGRTRRPAARALRQGAARKRRARPTSRAWSTSTNEPSNNFFAEMLLKRLAAPTDEHGHDAPRRRARSRRSRGGLGSEVHDGERLRPLALQPRLAARGRPSCSPRSDHERRRTRFGDSLPLAGREGTRRRPHERDRGRGPLPDQDRDPDRRQRAVGLLRRGPRHWSPSRS